jgi:type IV pilus assembly protein PilB
MIVKRANAAAIREVAIQNGMLTLRDMGLYRVREGLTTLEEVLRVTGSD